MNRLTPERMAEIEKSPDPLVKELIGHIAFIDDEFAKLSQFYEEHAIPQIEEQWRDRVRRAEAGIRGRGVEGR